MSESVTASTVNASEEAELFFGHRRPVDFPHGITELDLWKQIPTKGGVKIGFVDAREPKIVHLLSRDGKEIVKGGHPAVVSLSVERRQPKVNFSAMIVRTPARTPEKNYEDVIKRTAERLKGGLVEKKVGADQRLGILVVVEDKGPDTEIDWRQQQFVRVGISRDIPPKQDGEPKRSPGDGFMYRMGDYLVTIARIHKEHPYTDASRFVEPELTRINQEHPGTEVDTSELQRKARATRMPLATIAQARDRHGIFVTAEGTTVERGPGGQIISSVGEGSVAEQLQRAQMQKTQKDNHKPGDRIMLKEACERCGRHLYANYYAESFIGRKGNPVWMLKREISCSSDGLVRGFPENVRYLGKNYKPV